MYSPPFFSVLSATGGQFLWPVQHELRCLVKSGLRHETHWWQTGPGRGEDTIPVISSLLPPGVSIVRLGGAVGPSGLELAPGHLLPSSGWVPSRVPASSGSRNPAFLSSFGRGTDCLLLTL